MIWFAMLVLVLWFPIVYVIFELMAGEEAVVVSFIFAWLFLPTLQIGLPGIPDWSKTTATTFSIAFIAFVRQNYRIARLRFRWYDLPATIFCFCPVLSALSANQGLYDGLSASLEEVFRWGFPYLIGRAYLGSERGQYLMCLGLAVGGLIYAPLCLFEMRMSPVLKLWVYGFNERAGMDFGTRWGGYRPIVFLSFGLETAWWMCCATLACYNLWRGGAVKSLRGYPMSLLTMGMMFVALACKSTGALVLLVGGFGIFALARRTRSTALIYAVVAFPLCYCICRALGIWNGSWILSLAYSMFGSERGQSLAFRLNQEELLIRSAWGRPIFGYARMGGFNLGPDGKIQAVIDGLWIMVFGRAGMLGLISLNAMHMVPTILFLKRFRPSEWLTPQAAPALTFAMILPLYMVDNLSNAMQNPIYAVLMGSLSGYIPNRASASPNRRRAPGSGVDHLTAQYLRSLPAEMMRDQEAAEQEALAHELAEQGALEEAWEQFATAIATRQAAVDLASTPDRLDRLARSHVQFARFLTQTHYPQYAIDERIQALQVWRTVFQSDGAVDEMLTAHASNLNDLAWLLILDNPENLERIDAAIQYAEEAVQIVPSHAPCWNTLGIGYYRRRDFYKAIHALSRAVSAADDGGNAFDFYYLALANHALGYTTPARDWLSRAELWASKHPAFGATLRPIVQEAAAAFGTGK